MRKQLQPLIDACGTDEVQVPSGLPAFIATCLKCLGEGDETQPPPRRQGSGRRDAGDLL